ncbi:MAG: FHA domain-containing protein, partial [Pyrinomonadaceae bacterium]
MLEFTLTYPTPEGSREIPIDRPRTSFGRGSEADRRFADDGLSRLHAIIYRDGDRVWIVDENSSNGTFVNGVKTAAAGTPLRDGDAIRIGHTTNLKVRVVEKKVAVASATQAPTENPNANTTSRYGIVLIGAVGVATLFVSLAAVLIGYR